MIVESFYALFLDWSQAFDSVSHDALQNAFSRIGVPTAFADAVLSMYHDCRFVVKDSGYSSKAKKLAKGIRQGCPLSPYLFVSYGPRPSVLTSDFKLTDIEYADDTMLLSRTRLSLHRFVHTLQSHTTARCMALNHDKCQFSCKYLRRPGLSNRSYPTPASM